MFALYFSYRTNYPSIILLPDSYHLFVSSRRFQMRVKASRFCQFECRSLVSKKLSNRFKCSRIKLRDHCIHIYQEVNKFTLRLVVQPLENQDLSWFSARLDGIRRFPRSIIETLLSKVHPWKILEPLGCFPPILRQFHAMLLDFNSQKIAQSR
jgi:hypothetical protein